MSKHRSRRQRKKLRIGEFRELGFAFEATLHPDTDDDALIDAFLAEAVESRNLSFGGWITGGAVCHQDRRSVSEDERRAVLDWVAARPEIQSLRATDLYDMWHDTAADKELTPYPRLQPRLFPTTTPHKPNDIIISGEISGTAE